MFPHTNEGLSVNYKAFGHTFTHIPKRKYIFARTHSVWPHAVTWDEVFDPRCLPIFLLLYVPLCTGYSNVTSVADLRSPRVPSRWPNAGPRRKLNTEESERHHAGQKANVMCSPLMSPAKRTGSTLGPLGFIYPFFFFLLPQRVDWASSLSGATWPPCTQAFMYALSRWTVSASISSVRHWSVMLKGDCFWQKPAGGSGFLKETSPRECSLTSTRAAEAERTGLHAKTQNSSAAENERRPQRGCNWW